MDPLVPLRQDARPKLRHQAHTNEEITFLGSTESYHLKSTITPSEDDYEEETGVGEVKIPPSSKEKLDQDTSLGEVSTSRSCCSSEKDQSTSPHKQEVDPPSKVCSSSVT